MTASMYHHLQGCVQDQLNLRNKMSSIGQGCMFKNIHYAPKRCFFKCFFMSISILFKPKVYSTTVPQPGSSNLTTRLAKHLLLRSLHRVFNQVPTIDCPKNLSCTKPNVLSNPHSGHQSTKRLRWVFNVTRDAPNMLQEAFNSASINVQQSCLKTCFIFDQRNVPKYLYCSTKWV